MAESRLKFLLDLEDRVSPGMEKVNTSLNEFKGKVEDMKPAFQKMAAIGTAGFAAITGAVGLALKNYAEVERAQRQLEHAIMDVSKGTRAQVDDVLALTDALEKKSGVDADALNMGVAQLSTFGLQSQTVISLTKSLADLTVNQNGVNASADQYVQSANVVAKALNGQFGVLEKSGIRFTELQQNMILTGTESQKAAALIEGLNQNLRETTDTLAENGGIDVQMAKFNRSLGDVSDSVAKAMIPALNSIMKTIGPVVANIAAWTEANPKLTRNIILISAALFGLVAVVGTLGLVLPSIIAGVSAVGVVIGALMGPIGIIILAIGALIAVGVLLYKNWDSIKSFASEAWSAITTTISEAMQAIGNIVAVAWEGIKLAFWTATNFIIGAVANLLDFMIPGWDTGLMKMWASAVAIWGAISGFFVGAWDGTKSTFGGFLDWISEKWSVIWNGMKDVFSDIWNSIAAVFDSIVEGISNAMATLVAPIQKVIDLATKALSLAGGAVKSVGGAISSGVSSILSRGSSITGRASGGPVMGGTSYMVGERGPEMFIPGASGTIIPNHALAGAGNGGQNIYLTITGNTLLDRDAARKIGDDMVRYLKDNLRI